MIIGNGDIASVLPDRDFLTDNWFHTFMKPRLVFFASGVSNSQETREEEFVRETDLFLDIDEEYKDAHIVYFSSLSIFYTDTKYTQHKREMEEFVKNCLSGKYTIIRIGNITWGNNPNTFLNAYKVKPYELKDEYRYMLEKEEFLHWIDMIPSWNCEMNIPGKRMKVVDAIKQYGNT